MSTEEDLQRRLSATLHQMYPERRNAVPPDDVRGAVRRRPRGGLVLAAAASVAAVVAALAAGAHLVPRGPQPDPAAASSSAPTPTTSPSQRVPQPHEPAWATACFPTDPKLDYGNAPAYVGLTRSQAEAKARRNGMAVTVVGAGGHCATSSSDVRYVHVVALVFQPDTPGQLGPNSRVVAAHRVSGAWDRGWALMAP